MKLTLICMVMALQLVKKNDSLLTEELLRRIRYFCAKACGRSVRDSGYDVVQDDLYDQVMDKLLANDCEKLRKSDKNPPSDSWLKKVVSNTSTDMYRKLFGRPDFTEFEDLNKNIVKAVSKLHLGYLYPPEEIVRHLGEFLHVDITLETVNAIIDTIENTSTVIRHNPEYEIGAMVQTDEESEMPEYEFVNKSPNQEEALILKERWQKLQLFLARLTGDDKLLISLSFGFDEKGMTMKEIAKILKSTEGALQKRKKAIILEFNEWLADQQQSLDELIVILAARSLS